MSQMQVVARYKTCPVKSLGYERTLAKAGSISPVAARRFLSQWHAFSAAMPELLSVCAVRAGSDAERSNIVANLYSELGLDGDGVPHPELLKSMIEEATGAAPNPEDVTATTRRFVERLRAALFTGEPAFNAGVLLALEGVAYNILDVLKEILVKAGRPDVVRHPYITIHEAIEAHHIEHTEGNLELHMDRQDAVNAGYDLMMVAWSEFWADAYGLLVAKA